MSFANYDEIADVCWGMAEEEKALNEVLPVVERLELMKKFEADPNRWWEEVVKEILKEKEHLNV